MLKHTICNFVDEWQLNDVWTQFRINPRWIYRQFTGERWFWYYEVYRSVGYYSGQDERQWLPDVAAVWKDIHQKICDLVGADFQTWRVIVNGQTQGQDSAIHSDFPGRIADGETYIVYLNQCWPPEWGGATRFFAPDCQTLLAEVLPEPGKLIAYDGRIMHQGLGPTVPNVLRVTLAVQGRHG